MVDLKVILNMGLRGSKSQESCSKFSLPLAPLFGFKNNFKGTAADFMKR